MIESNIKVLLEVDCLNRIILMVLKNIKRVPGAYRKLCHYARNTDKYPEEEKYRHIQSIMNMGIEKGNIDFRVHGTENIPDDGGFMLYGNHQGMFDLLALVSTCHRPIGAVLRHELYSTPFINQISRCTHSFALERENPRQGIKVIQNVAAEVEKGRGYIIFPEGQRNEHGNEMFDFHAGSFKVAPKTKCPIVPFALIDSYKVLDKEGSKPVTSQIHYLPAICYDEYKGMKTFEIANMVRDRIGAVIKKYTEG